MAQFGTLAVKKILVSEFQMVFVSDGFFVFWQCSYLSDRSCRMPRFGTVELGAVCDGLGRLWFFVLQWWEEIRRGRGGLAPCSVCFVCSWSVEASYKRWLCPFVSPDPKWEAFRGQRVARASCLKRRRVLVGWSFIQVLQQGFVSVILDSRSYIFWGSWRYRLPSFLMCFWCLRNVSVAYALRIHGSSCPEVPAYTTFQAWSWDNFLPWTNQFETNQIPKRVMKNHGKTWVSEYGSQDLDWAFFCWSGCFHQRFSRPPQVQLNYAFDKLPWWSLRTTGSLADASYAERSDWCRTCWPIAAHRQWTRQRSGKVKTTLPVTWWYSGTATQHWTFHGIAYYRIHDFYFSRKTADGGVKSVEQISVSRIIHSATVPHALPRFHNPFSSSVLTCSNWKSNHAATSFVWFCVDWAAHEPGSCCQDGTSCDRMWWW